MSTTLIQTPIEAEAWHKLIGFAARWKVGATLSAIQYENLLPPSEVSRYEKATVAVWYYKDVSVIIRLAVVLEFQRRGWRVLMKARDSAKVWSFHDLTVTWSEVLGLIDGFSQHVRSTRLH